MSHPGKEIDLGFTLERFPDSSHICLIFDNEKQRRKIVSEYLAAGIRQGELARFAADVTAPQQVNAWLQELGLEPPEGNVLKVFKAESFYCPGGSFEPRQMIDAMAPRFEQARKDGFKGVRSCGEMSWALKGIPGSESLLKYEAMLGTVTGTFPHSGMCLYDARLFDGATLFKVLQLHPYMIAREQIVRNPYYLRPEEFMRKYDTTQT